MARMDEWCTQLQEEVYLNGNSIAEAHDADTCLTSFNGRYAKVFRNRHRFVQEFPA